MIWKHCLGQTIISSYQPSDLPVWPTLAAKDEGEREFTENIYVANLYCIFLMGGDWYTYLMVRKLLRIYVENI